MANIKGIVLTGDKELEKKLLGLEKKVYNRVVRGATERSMRPVRDSAKQRALAIKDTGLLAKSIGVKTKSYPRKRVVVSLVGPRKGFKREVTRTTTLPDGREVTKKMLANPANYAHLVEFGTQAHSLGGGSQIRDGLQFPGAIHPGTVARPFLRPAFDEKEMQILSIYRRELAAGVIREAMKRA